MAKRKRLTPSPAISEPVPTGLETKSGYPFGVAPKPRAPIAQVAGDAAAQSALEALADEMRVARITGRLVQTLALSDVTEDYMIRDRIVQDVEEMESLKASLSSRGQQAPIEVIDLGGGGFGLISGWRRLQALRALYEETGEVRFATVEALIKPLEGVSDSYLAMVEENEIRANLSFYERAHLACEAARLGVYPTRARAVQTLFANASATKRSKILSFAKLHEAMGAALSFPAAIPEKLGLALVSALEADAGFAVRLKDRLRNTRPQNVVEERAALERSLRKIGQTPAPKAEAVAPGIMLETRKSGLVLRGEGVTPKLRQALVEWLAKR